MSRFGLRSCSDGLKHLEEKNNRRKAANPTSSSKRIGNPKESKCSTFHSSEENLLDVIKIEADELEKCSDASDKCTKSKNNATKVGKNEDDDDDDGELNENDNDNDVENDYRQKSPNFKGTLVCSLPLDRISEIIQKLNLNKSKVEIEKESDEIIIDETLDNDDDEEDDTNISKQSPSNIKSLCLYCDRKFSSHKLQLKHVDKFHCLQQDRRCSGRNSQLQQQQIAPRKRKSATGSKTFIGCNFCQKPKGLSQPVILPAAELSSLFLHLADCHTDKYFGCKMCVVRFQNISKLSKHMEIVHKSLPFAFDESSSKSKDNDTDSLVSIDKLALGERSKLSFKRQQRSHKSLNSCMNLMGSSVNTLSTTSQCSTAITSNTSVIGAEEPILSRLGLTQNRLPNNRKGVRLRREKLLPELLLKSEQSHTSSTNFAFGPTTSMSASSSSSITCSPKLRGKSIKAIGGFSADTTSDVIFRIPTRNDILACVFDDNFYKEVVSNVRNNLLFHLDGKIMGNSVEEHDPSVMRHAHPPQIRSTLVKSPIVVTTMDSEIHAATSLAAVTAFPTLLTSKQFGGDTSSSKIRRPHTKNSWKWKWDNVKKFKLINEGGKIVKKMKHPMLGLRDLSKLDMWTQLTMRQKHEVQQQQKMNLPDNDSHWVQATTVAEISTDPTRDEKQRINEQLNFILDMRLLPHIILEQTEQAIIKLENDEFGIAPTQELNEDCGENFMAQTFADESFLSMLNLLPSNETENTHTKLVLSGEWARPRCYLCICCGSKFEKLKSLEEHKMFRHSQILSTHYEVVGRELLNGNLLRHLFMPKKALSRYGNESDKLIYSGAARRLFWHKNETIIREITNNEESSDSLQSVLHSCTTNSPSIKNSSSSTEDCDIDSKHSTTTVMQLIGNTSVVSPTHSIQSCSSSSSAGIKRQLKMQTSLRSTPITSTNINSICAFNNNNNNNSTGSGCSKCGRKSNGVLDLYRHMLDCSGDYIWSLAKKRKYRYYCGSKKRRPCNKHSILELRKSKNKPTVKSLSVSNDNTTEDGAVSSPNFSKIKSSPRSRPSDAESIKKMLENLPPKRICKKIFPALNKAKKSIKKIKPKILAKHKIYNRLRKTRVRQLSQAKKILSKTKSQLKNPKKIVTRSSTSTISSKLSQNRSNKNKKTMKMAMKKKNNEGGKLSDKPISNEETIKNNKSEKFKDEVDCCNIKTENEITKDILINETTTSIGADKPKEVEENAQISNKSCDKFTINNPKENFEQLPVDENLTTTATKQASETVLNTNCNVIMQKKDMPTNGESNGNSNKVASVSATITTKSERHSQVNTKIVKRSKRISDCIAMLTGKLEEKLKTEQKIPVLPVPEKSTVIPQPLKTLTTIVSPKHITHQPSAVLSKPVENVESEKCSPKKTPKRKTISRRIIKSDANNSVPLPVLPTNFENITHVSPKLVNLLEIMPPPKQNLTAKQTHKPHKISQLQESLATTSAVKNLPELMFSQGDNKRPINFIPAKASTSMPPPAGPPPASKLMPKMPLFMPLNNVRQPTAAPLITPMALPMSMPVPVPIPVPIPIETVSQTSPGALSSIPVAALGPNMMPPAVMPALTAVPAHLAIPPTLQLTVSSFRAPNAEPLNLSNSSKNEPKQTQDLSCAAIQRISGIPARRQTICGFEVRNFAVYDEIEPLDLSKKPRPEKTAITSSPFPPRQVEMSSLLLAPPPPSLGVANEASVLPITPLTSEALLNKHFYSNLDLLRIPQVRNPAGVQATICTNEPVQPAPVVIVNASPKIAPPLTKAANKKRNKNALQQTINSSLSTVGNTNDSLVSNSTANIGKNSNAKDTTNTNSKKQSNAKNKSVIRMDEEVINHIDDAINSVINAVNASLDSEEALKAQELITLKSKTKPPPPPPPLQRDLIQIKTSDDIIVAKEQVGEIKYLTAARRNMRSKTLDCRPAALNKACAKKPSGNISQQFDISAAIPSNNTASITTITPIKSSNIINNEMIQVKECTAQETFAERVNHQGATNSETKTNETQLKYLELEPKLLEKLENENIAKKNEPIREELSVAAPLTTIIVANCNKETLTPAPKSSAAEIIEVTVIPLVIQVEDAEAKNNSNTITTNTINLDLEHMSNNNNTSSGFHSSAQSDQQMSVMSTSTSALSVPNTVAAAAAGADTKKKQRRRRKNELAAIVADQLLESFKIDKARRDNLKKLENLAYEKSEDLLLTGMLLMSSTKRNVASSSSNIHSQLDSTESTAVIKRAAKSLRNNQGSEIHKVNDNITVANNKTFTESAIEKSLESDKDPLEVGESADGKKTNRRRQYRRRGKTLDNENISKLKSSLESFSIDIERQLNEYEAKNVNVFKNVQSNENSKQSCSSKNQASSNANKTSIVLRPSILSVTLEASVNLEIPQSQTKIVTNDSSKTAAASRDPRLNKNIHKEDEKIGENIIAGALKEPVKNPKTSTAPEEIGDLEEDNYLTEIAKNVNEKIMSTENEEFAFKNDGFELVNDMGMDDSNSKFSRPPTSMSVRSAPNFNDDRSNFGSICDENTNTEVMDMDLDDEMSVYTSYSQDLGRGRGRRRRRRRSILLTRKPKKRASSRDISAEKIECILCKKVFYSANSLSKHNMTLAHVSKVSEQEYLLSKSHSNVANCDELQTYGTLGPYARRTTRRSTISEPPVHSRCETSSPPPPLLTTPSRAVKAFATAQSPQAPLTFKSTIYTTQPETHSVVLEDLKQNEAIDNSKCNKTLQQKPTTREQVSDNEYDVNMSANAAYNGNSRLNLNPDERLFFECCNILKSAETPRLNNAANVAEECNNVNANFSYAYSQPEKSTISNIIVNRPLPANSLSTEPSTLRTSSNIHTNHNQFNSPQLTNSNINAINQQTSMQQPALFRDPQLINQLSCYKGAVHDNRMARSPTYSGISHLSAVTNTTSRFKTKAAMKGYENVKIDLNQQQESKSRTICKLTELAEIALGNEEKPNSHDFSPIRGGLTPPQVSSNIMHLHQTTKQNIDNMMCPKVLETPEYMTTLVTENLRESNAQLPIRTERTTKNNETRSSTSSKTIMHSSIIKAAVEEHQKTPTSNKIIIPDRPFKNIGLEEKETITFQKPKAPTVNLLTEDNNSVSTGSFSDRDDYDFGSLSCDDEVSLRESNDKNQKNNSTESSSESSRATAKTFENKSLIMGRIFKNASTKAVIKTTAVNTVKVKSVGVQKDQIPFPKADMNQLFDELRGNSGVDGVANEKFCSHTVVENTPVVGVQIASNSRANHKQYQQQRDTLKSFAPAASPPAVVSSTTATLPTNVRKAKGKASRAKSNAEAKTRKDISKLQTELGMSPDEIKKLIDEGQRKSKRRCATNRPKKLIEMWSSDEYEEFLSTKDIIALIEEKEQQEKRKKRKNSANTNEKELIPDVTSSTKDLKRRNTRRMSIAAERTENLFDREEILLPPKNTKTKKSISKKEEPVSTTAIIDNARELGASKKLGKVVTAEKVRGRKPKVAEVTENSSTLTTSDNISRKKRCSNNNNKNTPNKSKNKSAPKPKQKAAAKESSRAKHKKPQYEDDESDEDASDNDNVDDDDDDDDDDFLISELKNKQNKTRAVAGGKVKTVNAKSAAKVTLTTKASKPSKAPAISRETSTKKRSNNNGSSSNIAASSSNNPKSLQQNNQTPTKTKRKSVANQSPPRRKRLATEKLYYWSSSSDEDFGRINNNKINPQPGTYDCGAEQYQKHGWIVGDSHKKLVTLLAIAKGNKKVDSSSGVKKNIGKKRN